MEEVMVVDDVARILKVDRQRVYDLVRTDRIPVIRVGKRQYRFSAEAVRRWLEGGGSRKGGQQDEK